MEEEYRLEKIDGFNFKCSQCGRYFKSEEDRFSHTHVYLIAQQMRDDGEDEVYIQRYIQHSKEMGF